MRPNTEITSKGPQPSGATFASISMLRMFHHWVRSQPSVIWKSRAMERICAS